MTVRTAPKPLALDRSAQAALRKLRELRALRDDLDARIKLQEKKIKDAMGANEEATVGGRVVATWKTSIRQSTSLTLLKKAYPEACAECTVQTEVRTFKLIEDA